MKTKMVMVMVIASLALLVSATVWEGVTDVVGKGDLPGNYSIATNSFPRNSVVDITNLENGKMVRVMVVSGLETTGLLATLSRNAADSIDLRGNSTCRIRITQPSDDIAFSHFKLGPIAAPPPPVPAVEPDILAQNDAVDSDDAADYAAAGETPEALTGTAAAFAAEAEEPVFSGDTTETIAAETAPQTVTETVAVAPAVTPVTPVAKPTAASAAKPASTTKPAAVKPENAAAKTSARTSAEPAAPSNEGAATAADKAPAQTVAKTTPATDKAPAPTVTKTTPAAAKTPAPAVTDTPPRDTGVKPAETMPRDTALAAAEPVAGIPADTAAETPAGTPEYTAIEPVTAAAATPATSAADNPPEPRSIPGNLTIIPAEERLPDADNQFIIASEDLAPPLRTDNTSPPYGSYSSSSPEVSDFSPFQVPLISQLERDKWYVQLAAYHRVDHVEDEISRIGTAYPLAVQNIGTDTNPMFRVLLGPLNQGESGAMLQRFKSIGYNDAFIRHN